MVLQPILFCFTVRRLGIDLDELECKNHEINKLNDDVQNMEMKREQTEEKISSLTELYNQKLAEMEVLDASILPLKNIPLEIEELKISIQKIGMPMLLPFFTVFFNFVMIKLI